MQALELKLPPLALVLLVALCMWGAPDVLASAAMPFPARAIAAAALAVSGAGITLAGAMSFRRAGTTVNPTRPGSASALVRTGIYRVTRNPMYLGMLLVLLAWAVYLSNPLALPGPVVFVLYMNRFQIAPEEKALATLFGAEFSAYASRVRRWL